MTSQEIDLVRRALELLRPLVPDGQGRVGHLAPRPCPVEHFVREYIEADSNADLACAELWKFYQEVAQAGELPPMRRAVFLRQMPIAMDAVFSVKKCHSIERGGRRVRGFRGVGIRLDLSVPAAVDLKVGME